jgi:predicted DNA binding CopG/RHH family protein
MKRIKLTKQEKAIEEALVKNEYAEVSKKEFESIAKAVAARKKDTVLNIRVNSKDLQHIKHKAKKLGIKYQTFISEMLHRLAEV